MTYLPNWPENSEEAEKCGHGGGDFFVEKAFVQSLRTGEAPFLDAYRGITASNVGIIAWKSAHNGGAFMEIPDLRDEAACEAMLRDDLTPFDGVENSTLYPESMRWHREFKPEHYEIAREEWKKLGYTDEEVEEMWS